MNNISIMTASAANIPVEPVQKVSSPIQTDNVQNAPGKMVEDIAKSEENKKGSTDFSAKEAEELVSDLNEIMVDLQTSLGFFIREDLGHQVVVVEIKNRETNELIKQIPSEELLQIKEKMEELNGLIFDQSV